MFIYISVRYLGKVVLEFEKEVKEVFENIMIMKDFDSIEILFCEEDEVWI